MGVASGCGFKEIYRFPHTTYPYSSCICFFCSSIPTFCSFLKYDWCCPLCTCSDGDIVSAVVEVLMVMRVEDTADAITQLVLTYSSLADLVRSQGEPHPLLLCIMLSVYVCVCVCVCVCLCVCVCVRCQRIRWRRERL